MSNSGEQAKKGSSKKLRSMQSNCRATKDLVPKPSPITKNQSASVASSNQVVIKGRGTANSSQAGGVDMVMPPKSRDSGTISNVSGALSQKSRRSKRERESPTRPRRKTVDSEVSKSLS